MNRIFYRLVAFIITLLALASVLVCYGAGISLIVLGILIALLTPGRKEIRS